MLGARCVLLSALAVAPLLAQPQVLDKDLAARIKTRKLPGMAAVVFDRESVLAVGVAGVRETGKPEAISISDRFHIGSNAKAMLATVIGLLAEEGKLTWESRPIEAFAVPDANDGYAQAPLTNLLNHHAGLPAFEDESAPEWRAWIAYRQKVGGQGQPVQQFARWVLTQPPGNPPGSKFLYSNAGYSVVAAMAEQATGLAWNDLLTSRLFIPLKMEADFGLPSASSQDQPKGHYETKAGLTVQDSGERIPPFIQPAGDVQISILEYVKFLQLHLRGLAGEDGLLKSATIRQMHVPRDKMGFGWKIGDFRGAPASFHPGGVDTFYAMATLVPDRSIGVAVFTNAGGQRAEAACLETTKALLSRFAGARAPGSKQN